MKKLLKQPAKSLKYVVSDALSSNTGGGGGRKVAKIYTFYIIIDITTIYMHVYHLLQNIAEIRFQLSCFF